MKHVKLFVIAVCLAALPTTTALVVSAATPNATQTTKTLSDTGIPEAQCKHLFPVLPAGATDWKSCRIQATETRTTHNASPLASALGVQTSQAFNACQGMFYYDQKIVIGPAVIAQGFLEFTYCWGASDVQITWGPACWTRGSVAYGTGTNHCTYPSGDIYPPAVIQYNWYLFPYSLPWYHVDSVMQSILYPGWNTYSQCYNCD